MVEPGGGLVVFREEGALHPVTVASLDETQHEDLLAVDLGDALDLHLAGIGGHRRPTGSTRQARRRLDCLAIDLPGTHQRHLEVVAGAGVTLHEHVVGDHPEAHLGGPHPRPLVSVVVDVAEQGRLGTDLGPGGADTTDRLAVDGGIHLLPVVEVRHEGDVLAGSHQLAEQREDILGVGVGDEAVGPEGQALGADEDVLDVVQLGGHHPLKVLPQVLRLHHHGAAAGHQEVGDLGVLGQVAMQRIRLAGGEL